MLTTRLEQIWGVATPDEQISATVQAKKILENLVAYRAGHRYYPDDLEMLAAELLAWRETGCTSPCVDNYCPIHGIGARRIQS